MLFISSHAFLGFLLQSMMAATALAVPELLPDLLDFAFAPAEPAVEEPAVEEPASAEPAPTESAVEEPAAEEPAAAAATEEGVAVES